MTQRFPPRVDHVAMDTKSLEGAFEFFSKLFGVELPGQVTHLSIFDEKMCPNLKWGKYRLASIPTGGPEAAKLEMYEARDRGWERELLQKTDGDIVVGEIGFEVDDIEKYYDRAKAMGLTPADVNGEPLVARKFDSASENGSEIRFFFLNLPVKPYKGPLIEIIQYL